MTWETRTTAWPESNERECPEHGAADCDDCRERAAAHDDHWQEIKWQEQREARREAVGQ